MSNTEMFRRIFDYLSQSETGDLKKSDGAFVFCRCDVRVAEKAALLYHEGLVQYVMVTGGIGKDSGALGSLGMTEAWYQASLLRWKYEVPDDRIVVESTATNGGENIRKGIDAVVASGHSYDSLTLVVHATSGRRVLASFDAEAPKKNFQSRLQLVHTDYPFDPGNPHDQREAVAELLRLADWPAKGWAVAQPDLPHDLVEFARSR